MRTCKRKEEAADGARHWNGRPPAAALQKLTSRLQFNQTVLPVVGKWLPFPRRADKKYGLSLRHAYRQQQRVCRDLGPPRRGLRPTLYVNHHWKKSGGRVCSDIIPASSPLLCSAPYPHFPLPAQDVYRHVLFLKRPRRSLPRPLGDPVSQGAHPRSILCKNCTHGRGECRSPPPVISPVLRARASRH